MPPQRSLQRLQNEGKLSLAVHAIENDQIHTIRSAARVFEVPQRTLNYRLHGRVARVDYRPVGHKLTTTEEETLRAWLIDMDNRGYPLSLQIYDWPQTYCCRHDVALRRE